jgi:hypothetical protein
VARVDPGSDELFEMERVDPGSDELLEMERVEAEGPAPKTPCTGTMERDSWARYKEPWGILLCVWQRVAL